MLALYVTLVVLALVLSFKAAALLFLYRVSQKKCKIGISGLNVF